MKLKWTAIQQAAIIESIKHWQENVAALKEADAKGVEIVSCELEEGYGWYAKNKSIFLIASFSANECALCFEYLQHHKFRCNECPLCIIEDKCGNPNSPWYQCRLAKTNPAIILAANNMLQALLNLLKEDKQPKTLNNVLGVFTKCKRDIPPFEEQGDYSGIEIRDSQLKERTYVVTHSIGEYVYDDKTFNHHFAIRDYSYPDKTTGELKGG